MKIFSLKNSPVQTPDSQLARLSEPHGYRFDGDRVHLNAMFRPLDRAAHELSWALQLWACSSAPASPHDLVGHIVAEAPLPPTGGITDEIEHCEVSAFAWLPAGAGEHVMVLVLASGRPGQFHVVHDFAIYSCRQQFIQPRIKGNVDYRIDGAHAHITVERVENPRPAANHSGTLSLELWALSAPFTGGHFEGHHLAGVEIGSVNGQNELVLQPLDLAFIPPPAGDWHFVLMLREWTCEGFVTRDFTNLASGFVSAPLLAPPVVFAEEIPVAVADETVTPVLAKASAEEVDKAVTPASSDQAPAEASAGCVCVNTAGVEELAAVKGLSVKIAEAIVKKRPFASLDDLRRVKGLGTKVLAKARSSLKL